MSKSENAQKSRISIVIFNKSRVFYPNEICKMSNNMLCYELLFAGSQIVLYATFGICSFIDFMLDWSVYYASWGLKVFPIKPGQKSPPLVAD